jgi:hypothetical protein
MENIKVESEMPVTLQNITIDIDSLEACVSFVLG